MNRLLASALSKISYDNGLKEWCGYMTGLEAKALIGDGARVCSSSIGPCARLIEQSKRGGNRPNWLYFNSLGKHSPITKKSRRN